MLDGAEVKIKINEYESYILTLPKEIDSLEFSGMVDRLNLIKRTLIKELSISENIKENKVIICVEKYKPETREDVLEMLKMHFFGNESERKGFMELNNLKGRWYDVIGLNVKKFKDRYSITPIELGLKSFPRNRWEFNNIGTLKLKNGNENEL